MSTIYVLVLFLYHHNNVSFESASQLSSYIVVMSLHCKVDFQVWFAVRQI